MNRSELHLFHVHCAGCGLPTVTTALCARPDLCYPCFTARRKTTGEVT